MRRVTIPYDRWAANCSEGGKEEKEEDPMTEGKRTGERERGGRAIRSFVNLRLFERERDIYVLAVLQKPRVYRNARKAA